MLGLCCLLLQRKTTYLPAVLINWMQSNLIMHISKETVMCTGYVRVCVVVVNKKGENKWLLFA